jgi:hypothetical protein
MTHATGGRLTAMGVRYFVAMTGALALVCYLALYTRPDAGLPIHSDGYSYYVYLPSWLIYRDVTLEALAREWYGGTYPTFTQIVRWAGTGRWVNPHPIGPAVLMVPWFTAGHLLTRWSNLPPDGFSLYYQHAAGLAGLAYFLAGLAVLRRTLTRHFSCGAVLAALVAITWGTNLFHYGVFDSTFSHVYSFFLICVFIELTERWWAAPTLGVTCGLGLTAALVCLARHTNAIFLLILPLYGVAAWRDVRSRAVGLWQRRSRLAIMAGVAILGVLPQLAIYRQATGSWLISPYGALDVGFTFRSPYLIGVLFSTQKGLFFWSPVLLLAVAGMAVTRGWPRNFVVPAAIALALDTYLIASWQDWQFGASYGHRGFTDTFGLLAVFLAAFFAWTAQQPGRIRVVAAGTTIAVALSIVQMLQYWRGIVPIANTTWAQYRELFLQFP